MTEVLAEHVAETEKKQNTRQKTYYQENKEEIRAYYKEWYKANKDSVKGRCRLNYLRWLEDNRDYYRQYRKEHDRKKKEVATEDAPIVSSKRHAIVDFNSKDIDEITHHINPGKNQKMKVTPITCRRSVTLNFD
jgi:vacuolar-type H+-ATPase subunit H